MGVSNVFAIPGLFEHSPVNDSNAIYVLPDGSAVGLLAERASGEPVPRFHIVGLLAGGAKWLDDASMRRVFPRTMDNGNTGYYWVLPRTNGVPLTAVYLHVGDLNTRNYKTFTIRRERILPFATVFTAEELEELLGDESGQYLIETSDGFVISEI